MGQENNCPKADTSSNSEDTMESTSMSNVIPAFALLLSTNRFEGNVTVTAYDYELEDPDVRHWALEVVVPRLKPEVSAKIQWRA